MSSVNQAFWGFLTTDGSMPDTRSALTNLKVDGSGSPVIFYAEAPVGGSGIRLNRINGVVDTSGRCYADNFAGGAGVLATGFKFQIRDSAGNVADASPLIKSNLDLCFLSGVDVGHADFDQSLGRDTLIFRWTIGKGFFDGAPILPAGWRLEAVVQDDFTAAGWKIDDFDLYLQGDVA